MDGIERFEALRSLGIDDVKDLTDLRPIERATGLRHLSISTKRRQLAEAVAELDLSRLPELRDVRKPIRLATKWIPKARWLRHLDLKGFAPASGTYEDITGAPRLMNLTLTASRPADLREVHRALPLTSLHWHDMALYATSETFGMFNAKGEKAVARMVRELTGWLKDSSGRPRVARLNHRLAEQMQAIDASGHHGCWGSRAICGRGRSSGGGSSVARASGWASSGRAR